MNEKMDAKIRIGTSGYSFLDWVGPFYPPKIPRGKMLDYYVQYFDTVEINSSYYSIPHPKVFESMVKKVPEGFGFFVKAHKSLTHDRQDVIRRSNEFTMALQPLIEANVLEGILLQFPYSFKYSIDNLNYLRRANDLLSSQNVIVEFRHRGWIRDGVFDMLRNDGITYCSVDEPRLEGLLEPDLYTTTNRAYVRFHGRNRQKWWKGGGERYDYLYDEKELNEWAGKLESIKKKTKYIYLFFNNCHHGQAVKNARMMADILQLNIGAPECGDMFTQ